MSRPMIRICAGLAVLAMILAVLSGCATQAPVKAAEAVEEAAAAKGPTVLRLEDGREGFVITELPQADEALRQDFEQAVSLLNGQEYAKAADLLEKIVARSPGVTAPYIDLAIACEHLGKPEQAEKHLKTALSLFPGHPAASNECGLLYRKSGRFPEAREVFEKALAAFPDYYPLHRNLGILCDLYLNDPACALEQYEFYSRAMPGDHQVEMWIADLRNRMGRDAK